MQTPEFCIIAATDQNRGIGKDNKLPWNIPEDLKRFRELTVPYSVIMGRRTFDSIIERNGVPLPKRHNFVLSRDPSFSSSGVHVARSLGDAFWMALQYEDTRIAVIGGEQIFREAIDYVNKLYLTVIEGQFQTDASFPDYSAFNVVSEVAGQSSNGLRYKFQELTR